MNTVAFPGLGLEFQMERVAFSLLGHPIYWYGIIIACGFLLAVTYCYRRAPQFGVVPDDLLDLMLFAVPLCITGARLYYIVFYPELFRGPDGGMDPVKMIRIWDGGLAIYGGIIMAFLVAFVFTRVRKLSFAAYGDLCAFGLLIGQSIGRWGNFVNVEAFGGPTDLPWRMGIQKVVGGAAQYMEVHPTFLYESLWNLLGFFLLVWLAKKGLRKFDGMFLLLYVIWYGFGRSMIEGLRTDSLYFFGLELFGMPIRTSQMLGFCSAAIALCILLLSLKKAKTGDGRLYVDRIKNQEKEGEDHGSNSGREGPGSEV